MRCVVVSNPNSRSALHHEQHLRRTLDAEHVTFLACQRAEDLEKHQDALATDLVVANGGDGTLQKVLTALFQHNDADSLPTLAVLPSGTTNMSAFDINHQRSFITCARSLQRLLTEAQPPAQRVCALCVDQGEARHLGFFFGLGDIVRGIEYFHHRITHASTRNQLGAGLAMLGTLWSIVRRREPFDRPTTLQMRFTSITDTPTTLGLRDARLMFATTLDRLLLGWRPYWGDAVGADARYTVVQDHAYRLLRNFPALLQGQPSALMTEETGYESGALDTLELRFDGPFTLDGELYEGASDTPVTLSVVRNLRFHRL